MLPTLGAYRLGALPPDDIENWLNDEIEAGTVSRILDRRGVAGQKRRAATHGEHVYDEVLDRNLTDR